MPDALQRVWSACDVRPRDTDVLAAVHHMPCCCFLLQAIVRLAVLAILLISAAAVTKLMAINISSTRNIGWSNDLMQQKIAAAMQVSLSVAALCRQGLHMCSAEQYLQQHSALSHY